MRRFGREGEPEGRRAQGRGVTLQAPAVGVSSPGEAWEVAFEAEIY